MARQGRKGPRARRRAMLALKATELGALAPDALTLVPGHDGRTKIARRARRIAVSLFKELGGEDNIPEWRKQLIQRCAFASIACERLETTFLNGGYIDQELHAKATRTLALMLRSLGLDLANSPKSPFTTSPDDAHEVQLIRRVIVDSKEPVPERT